MKLLPMFSGERLNSSTMMWEGYWNGLHIYSVSALSVLLRGAIA